MIPGDEFRRQLRRRHEVEQHLSLARPPLCVVIAGFTHRQAAVDCGEHCREEECVLLRMTHRLNASSALQRV